MLKKFYLTIKNKRTGKWRFDPDERDGEGNLTETEENSRKLCGRVRGEEWGDTFDVSTDGREKLGQSVYRLQTPPRLRAPREDGGAA